MPPGQTPKVRIKIQPMPPEQSPSVPHAFLAVTGPRTTELRATLNEWAGCTGHPAGRRADLNSSLTQRQPLRVQREARPHCRGTEDAVSPEAGGQEDGVEQRDQGRQGGPVGTLVGSHCGSEPRRVEREVRRQTAQGARSGLWQGPG